MFKITPLVLNLYATALDTRAQSVLDIRAYVDRLFPQHKDNLPSSSQEARQVLYRLASQGRSKEVRPGMYVVLKSSGSRNNEPAKPQCPLAHV